MQSFVKLGINCNEILKMWLWALQLCMCVGIWKGIHHKA